MLNREKVETLRKQYPSGCRVRLDHMDDPQAPADGTCGTVSYVDDAGNIHVKWDNGSSLSLVHEDRFHKIKEERER